MRKAELKTFWHSTPFVPFNIELRSFGEKDNDHTSVDVMLIKAVETARNGSKNRRRGSR